MPAVLVSAEYEFGLRIPDLLAAGASHKEVLTDYPLLKGDIVAALQFAARQSNHPISRVAGVRFLIDAQLPPALARLLLSVDIARNSSPR